MKRIAVLCGGDGSEREVSLRSGKAVSEALREAGFEAEAVDLTSLEQAEGRLRGFEGAFIAMHGDWGEDGRLQAHLEAEGIPYTGSGPEACALAMDKWRARERFQERGLRVPRALRLPDAIDEAEAEEVRAALGADVVVKPRFGGSTVGISIVRGLTANSLEAALELARDAYHSDVFAEEFIEGRELTAAVWERDGRPPEALPVIEIIPHSGFYDYKNKYTAGATEYIVPAPLEPGVAARVGRAAVEAHQALGCLAYSRADFRLAPDGTLYILEVNTAPGMTATSLVPKAAAAAGFPMPEFVKQVAQMARLAVQAV